MRHNGFLATDCQRMRRDQTKQKSKKNRIMEKLVWGGKEDATVEIGVALRGQ